ncbi:hypothetical protein Tsubulata_037597, partial [Turnera subulata]
LQNSSDADKHDGGGDSGGVTHILSLLSETSISFFKEWRGDITIPVTHQIKRVFLDDDNDDDDDDDDDDKSSSSKSCLYSLEKAGKVVRMAVPLKDMESQNLVDYLEPCLDFIHLHRTPPSSVLVHCFAGVSRSAALKMFGEMGFKVDHTNPLYKRFRLKVLGDSYNRGEKIDSSKFGTDPGIYKVLPSKSEGCPDGGNKCTAYRCKKCRRVVALQENVVDHVPDDGDASFAWHKRKSGNLFNKSDMSECSSLFLREVRWRGSCPVFIARLAWVTSIGVVSSVVVEAGSPQLFRSIKVVWILVPSSVDPENHKSCQLVSLLLE